MQKYIINNININYKNTLYTYAAEYERIYDSHNYKFKYADINGETYIVNDNSYIKTDNIWKIFNGDSIEINSPDINVSKIRILFPLNSIEVYDKNIKYIVDICLWFGDKKITLYSGLISRIDSLANDKILNIYEQEFIEYVDLIIPEPNDLLNYLDYNIRNKLREENDFNYDSLLKITIIPVEYYNGNYYVKEDCDEGYNIFKLYNNSELSLKIDHTLYEKNNLCQIKCNVTYNHHYNSIKEYIEDFYGVETPSFEYELIIKDNDLKLPIKVLNKISESTEETFNISDLQLEEFDINNNKIDYIDKLSIICSLTIYDNNSEEILYILSNEIPLTMDLIGYFIEKDIEYVNLADINMETFNINIVNKTINNVVKIDNNTGNSKSNIIQPVFFKVMDLSNIIIHPDVTENLCINLDSYKSKVKSFMIKIEGISFSEIGRTHSGVIFKILGSSLPQSKITGTYYITDQDSNVITNGKYNYEY